MDYAAPPVAPLPLRRGEDLDKGIQEARDKRVKLLREVLNGVKVVKSLGWEPLLKHKVEATREEELEVVGAIQYLFAKIQLAFQVSPMLIKAPPPSHPLVNTAIRGGG